jgi:hypothetical protein
MCVTTYRGIVRGGKVEPVSPLDLPDGSEVYVVVPENISARVAKRKANGWLVGYVGNMLMAGDGTLVRGEQEWVWRLDVYITSLSHEPWGPIGTVDVDATSGAIIDAERTKALLYERGRAYPRPI